MEYGGNKNAQVYFDKHDLFTDGNHNFGASLAYKYRTMLSKKVLFQFIF